MCVSRATANNYDCSTDYCVNEYIWPIWRLTTQLDMDNCFDIFRFSPTHSRDGTAVGQLPKSFPLESDCHAGMLRTDKE